MTGALETRPYLSVVATARNDDHGGNPLYRMQLFVDGLIAQCDRHRLRAELVLVEWNPPADRPGLAEVLTWPRGEGWCDVRVVQVPPELHSRLEHADRLPLFQMIAKNVGIRRARGEFVLATNIDLLFSDELMAFITRRELRPDRFYRVDRHDVPAELDPAAPIAVQLRFCRENVIRVNRYNGTRDLLTGTYYRIYDDVPFLLRMLPKSLHPRMRMLRYILFRIYAFFYWIWCGLKEPRLAPGRIKKRLRRMLAAAQPAAGRGGGTPRRRVSLSRIPRLLWLLARGAVVELRERARAFRRAWEWEKSRLRLHTNASGDFTLMSKDAWEKTRGYAELEMYSMHIDGLQLYFAYYMGLREQRLPYPIYHIEHEGGFQPGSQKLDERLARDAIPQITNERLMEWIYDMYVKQEALTFNDPNWGFAGVELPEIAQLEPALTRTHTEVA